MRRVDSGRWEARYRGPDGREHSRRFPTKREAQAFLERTGADRQRGEWRDPQGAKVLMADWVEAWWATTVNLRPSSRARDEAYIRNHVLPAFGAMPLGAITQLDIRAWVAQLDAGGKAPATVQKAYQTLSKILRAAVDAGLIAQSPCRRIGLPRVEREEMRFLTPAEISALAEAIEPRYRALVLFDAYCGLRLGELAGPEEPGGSAPAPYPGHRDRRRGEGPAPLRAAQDQGRPAEGAAPPLRGRRDGGPPRHLWRRRPGLPGLRRGRWGRSPGQRVAGPLAAGDPGGRARAASAARPPAHRGLTLGGSRGEPEADRRLGGTHVVSVVLDRYGHLFPGHEEAVLERLDTLAITPLVTAVTGNGLGVPRGTAGFSRGERERREPESSPHAV